ncbi:2-amino-4-hydroxy-6-hydroxymethyldihydropteridine diphosphokinase [Salinispira pacifica]|uniref:2-amino-4-hydroxy-6-hydroxymethyldihydropteridine pyrophosphokinase n=1 Tax=Salinispira pacifica TaxID=1307761 RepID=V5WH94_9SPIO|nr:2-amino-4-hydroxy-6-hydroxymethyldihydropteridine diphosphokinase [Salinispira pacifica]AHC15168.1 2-amino-4-hydroxy-6- hydroxymethyldihydropteridine pyrophosphokinase [Salinispira pacifica]
MVYLSLGSNSGNSEQHLVSALEELKGISRSGFRISSLYASTPQGLRDQPDFLNCACCLNPPPHMKPRDVLREIHRIERSRGRNRSGEIRWGPRNLDIDIILWNDLIVPADDSGNQQSRSSEERQNLIIPHPRYHERRFVLVPLLELNSRLTDPRSGEPLENMERELRNDPSQGIYLSPRPLYNGLTSQLRKNN